MMLDALQANGLMQILLLTLMAGLAMPVGAALASVERIHPRWLETEVRHSVIAFGGGALLAAVALHSPGTCSRAATEGSSGA